MFSIIIPLYNKELSVTKTIESVLNQTYKDFEIIIVNDGSTDNSYNVVKTIKDKRIKLIDKKNGGVSSARNKGIKEANFEWICFLDADDLWLPDHLQTLAEMIQLYPANLVFSTGYIRSNTEFPKVNVPQVVEIEDYFKEAIKNHFFWTSITCIHKNVFDKVGDFNILLNRGEDLELWSRIGRKFSFIKSNKITGIYRVDAENRSDNFFCLNRSRVYNYNFIESKSVSEYEYYHKEILKTFKRLVKNKDWSNFLKLKRKHMKDISYLEIIKSFFL